MSAFELTVPQQIDRLEYKLNNARARYEEATRESLREAIQEEIVRNPRLKPLGL